MSGPTANNKAARGASFVRSTQADSLVVHFDDASDEEMQEETVTKRVLKRSIETATAAVADQTSSKKAKPHAHAAAARRTVVTTVRLTRILYTFVC